MSKPVQPLQRLTEAVRGFTKHLRDSVVWMPSATWFLFAHFTHVDSGTLVGLELLLIAPASCARIAHTRRIELAELRILNSTYLDAKLRDEVAFKAGRIFEREFVGPLGEDGARGYAVALADDRVPVQVRRANGSHD